MNPRLVEDQREAQQRLSKKALLASNPTQVRVGLVWFSLYFVVICSFFCRTNLSLATLRSTRRMSRASPPCWAFKDRFDISLFSNSASLHFQGKGNAAVPGLYWDQKNPNAVKKNTGNRRKKKA